MESNFEQVFNWLRPLLKEYESSMVVKAETAADYYLDTPPSSKYPKGLFFGAAQIKKNYVSYYLMPVYGFPDLLEGISPALKKRMQGKSCFNFTRIEEALLDELRDLTRRGFERFRAEELV